MDTFKTDLIKSLRNPTDANFQMAIKYIPVIVQRLGIERTISEFIPYTFDFSNYKSKEIIEFLHEFEKISLENVNSDTIGRFLIEFSQIFLLNNRVVDQVALESIQKLLFTLDPSKISNVLTDYVLWLVNNPVMYLRRLAPHLLKVLTDEISKKILLTIVPLLLPLCEDPSYLVRESIAKYLGMILDEFDGSLVPDIRNVIQKLLSSGSNSILVHIPVLLYGYVMEETHESVIEFCNSLLSSTDWRVRQELFINLDTILCSCTNSKDVLGLITKGLIDKDDDVALAAAKQFEFFINHFQISQEDIDRIFGSAMKREDPRVVIALAGSLPTLFNGIYKEFSIKIMVDLIKKNNEKITKGICDIFRGTSLPDNIVQSLMENIISIKEWRTRSEIAQILPSLISKMTPDIMCYISMLLEDDVIAVRNNMCKIMGSLVIKFGDNWVRTDLIPTLSEMMKDVDYQIRQTALVCLDEAKLLEHEDSKSILEQASKDSVSNVRLILAKIIPVKSPICQVLSNDEDPDVKDVILSRGVSNKNFVN